MGVEGIGDGDVDLIVDLPQDAHDVGESSELEGGGQVDGLVDGVLSVDGRGAAGRQVGQLGLVEADWGQAGDGERVAGMVVQQQLALRRVGGIAGAVAAKCAIEQLGRWSRTLSDWSVDTR
ncbi:hypothetical protein SAZ_31590 [Streptomyces noursei ZPM]|nr:hypothetical protein [Streptomyces noursei]AKA08951.1 hypothetical protein SAZ_31590 [Streptomyces noursei ZPM]EOT02008.1 hypothetical protein K530_20931 [Streptomyces noursei CCRC 11814]EXU88916.1 hypothetical protein P354_26745 [Streptomyces noursei PD-1]UWS77526.1 hypothetical protein N1H47_29350 [Streptomyces noursei]